MKKIVTICICISLIIVGYLLYVFYNNSSKLVNINEIETDSDYVDVTYEVEEDILEEDVLGILTIDKIGLKATVKEGSDNATLKNHIGHIENTAIYDGNIALAGHNRGNKYSYFARLNELEEGDIVIYKTKFYTRQYKVNSIKAIFETDLSVLENTEANKITMITCIANKKNQRLCVQATEIME